MAIRYVALTVLPFLCLLTSASAIGVNWGIQSSHPLPPSTVVQMMKDNGIQKVKLFEADEGIMEALKKSGIQVMVGIPNDLLDGLGDSAKTAENWVAKNLSKYVNDGVDVRLATPSKLFCTVFSMLNFCRIFCFLICKGW